MGEIQAISVSDRKGVIKENVSSAFLKMILVSKAMLMQANGTDR